MTVLSPAKVFADRIGRIEVSATMAVAAEAAKLRAQGANLVDFGAGEPHFPTPRHIKDAAIAAIDSNFTRYTVVPGIPDVRRAIVERHATDFGSDYPIDEAAMYHLIHRGLHKCVEDRRQEAEKKEASREAPATRVTPTTRPSEAK